MDFSPSPRRPTAVPARSVRPSSIPTSPRPAARTRSTSTSRVQESQTIDLASPLPPITTSVLIDGTTQPGFAGTPLIALGNQSPGSPGPFTISGGDVTIRGLAVDSVMIDATSAGFLIADLHSQGQSNQLSLLNTPGQVVVQSDGLSSADTDAAIAEHLAGGDYSLDGDSTGGPGSAIWTILLTPTLRAVPGDPRGGQPIRHRGG